MRSLGCVRPPIIRPRGVGEAGFTLIEAMVALAVVAVSLTAIGSVMAASVRATGGLGERLALVETARTILTDLPDRAHIVPGLLWGESSAHRWRGDVLPFTADFIDPGRPSRWMPQAVALSVRSPGGRVLRIDTIRLQRGQ